MPTSDSLSGTVRAMAGTTDPDSGITAAGEPIKEDEALQRLRQTDDQSLQYYAAWWLGRMRSRHPDTVPLLRSALRQRQPRDPGAGVEHNAVARNAARALGKLGDGGAVPDLLAALEDDDDGLREAAARALGELGALEAVEPICARLASGLAGAGAPMTNSPKLQEPCEALIEALGAIGVADPAVVGVIEPFSGHDRPLVRSAAARALLQLTTEVRWGESKRRRSCQPASRHCRLFDHFQGPGNWPESTCISRGSERPVQLPPA